MTGAGGTFSFPSLGWDTYALSLSESSYNLLGTIPLGPLIINPSSTASFTFVLQSAANPSLLIGAVDAVTGAGLQNATVTITTTGFLAARTTGHAFVTQSNWAGGQYTSQNGINPNTSGTLTMMQNASGTYSTTTTAWLISNTMDLGSSSSTLYSFSWNPQSQPPSTGPNSVKFQLAANNDQATWNFIGPDGTAGSFYTASSTLGGRFDGNRYVRYEVYMSTQDANTSPSVTSASLEFNAICVPPAQTLFTNLSQGTYVVDVTAPSHIETTSTVSVGSGFNQTTISLTHT